MANPLTFTSLAQEPVPRPSQPPQLPLPANAVPQPSPLAAVSQWAGGKLAGWQRFRLDPDIALALQDQQQASGQSWEQWIEQAANEALRDWIGRG
jgi:hypothetical protein